MNENILLIGYSSQNMASGVSLSFDSLIDGFKLIDYQPEVIYIVDSRKSATYGSFSLTRVKDSLKAIFEALQNSQSRSYLYDNFLIEIGFYSRHDDYLVCLVF